MKDRTGRTTRGAIVAALAFSLAMVASGCGVQTTGAETDSKATTQAQAQDQAASSATSTDASTTSADASTTSAASTNASTTSTEKSPTTGSFSLTKDDIQVTDTIADDADASHAITADGESKSYANVEVTKTGSDDGDEADFYGTNAAVFATNGATLDLTDAVVTTDGQHANAVFSYGEGTTVNISHSVIKTTSNTSGGIMVTGGGTINATDLAIHTTGNSSAAIRSDRGGGTENVSGGSYVTDGTGSPVIYSTADVNVSGASLTSTSSQGVVVEGKNSVSLTDCILTADNNSKNSDKSDWYQAVMIYQSMSGDAAEGEASFSMDGGSLTNKNGDAFFVNNTVATIDLAGVAITNEDASGNFLRAAAAGWGSEGSNGGHVTLNAKGQEIDGTMLVDEVSSLNLYLDGDSSFEGTINPDGAAGEVYVELAQGAKWVLTADAYITSLSCDADAIDLNGHTLHVGDATYEEGSASQGEAIVVEVKSTTSGGPGGDGGTPPEAPPDGSGSGRPEGAVGEPPAKPGESNSTSA